MGYGEREMCQATGRESEVRGARRGQAGEGYLGGRAGAGIR